MSVSLFVLAPVSGLVIFFITSFPFVIVQSNSRPSKELNKFPSSSNPETWIIWFSFTLIYLYRVRISSLEIAPTLTWHRSTCPESNQSCELFKILTFIRCRYPGQGLGLTHCERLKKHARNTSILVWPIITSIIETSSIKVSHTYQWWVRIFPNERNLVSWWLHLPCVAAVRGSQFLFDFSAVWAIEYWK